MQTLIEVQSYLQRVPGINQGGCAIAALAMKRWLEKKGISSHITYNHNEDEVGYYNNMKRRQGIGWADSCMHALINCQGKLQDSCGLWFGRRHGKIKNIVMSEEMVLESINCSHRWNPQFNRAHVNEIAEVLDIDLSDIKLRPDEK